MRWGADDWLRTADGSGIPALQVPGPDVPAHAFAAPAARSDFDGGTLPIEFQWLRSPHPDEIFSLTARPGHLRLYGRETIGSLFRQSLVARRQQAHCFSASTALDFEPEHFQQMAGLVCYYGGAKFHYLHISHDETLGTYLAVMSALPDSPQADAFWFNLKPEAWKNDPRFAFVRRPEFRQAISYAVDREKFAENVFLGAAVISHLH